MSKTLVTLNVNNATHQVAIKPQDTLALALRDGCGLTGTKVGCDMGTCGCCTVLVDGEPVLGCLTLALEVEGRQIETIEGLAGAERLHPLQRAFAECGGSQCGFCTPGFVMTSVALLRTNKAPSRDEIKAAIAGNLCRCTGYAKIVDAVEHAADDLRGVAKDADEPTTTEPGEKDDAGIHGRRQPATAGR
jgi:aerobic-type carbon monoxide dehydrogenase small subunit (CoxS/CutS family)